METLVEVDEVGYLASVNSMVEIAFDITEEIMGG